jgi:hypothetical protein
MLWTIMSVVSMAMEKEEVGDKVVGKVYQSIYIWSHEMLLRPTKASYPRLC